MRRRNFLKTIAGVFGALAAGLKIKPAAVPMPAPTLTDAEIARAMLPGPRWIVDEWCPDDRIYFINFKDLHDSHTINFGETL